MGHIGLTPQSVHALGGFRTRGRSADEGDAIIADAKAIAEAGAFTIVVEGVIEPLADRITEAIAVPTIGIGASLSCDGQVLVTDDLLGLFSDFTPKFVRRYAQLGQQVAEAAANFAEDVRKRRFPGPENVFAPAKPKPAPERTVPERAGV